MTEQWKPVLQFESFYSVSDQGRVRSDRTGQILRPRMANGRRCVTLTVNGQTRTKSVYRLMLESFVGPCPDGHESSHLNGIKTDDHLDNLVWETHEENCRRRVAHGTEGIGENNPNAKLSAFAVRVIRRLIQLGEMTQGQIGDMFGVTQTMVSYIKLGKSWS